MKSYYRMEKIYSLDCIGRISDIVAVLFIFQVDHQCMFSDCDYIFIPQRFLSYFFIVEEGPVSAL